jgi:flagellar motility protein MotE (MotC chaperone)
MGRLLKSSPVVAILGALLYLTTTAALLRPDQFEPFAAPSLVAHSETDDPSWNFRNPEFQQWVEEIRHEKETLTQRAQQLQELQLRLDAERQEILTITQAVHQLQVDFDKNVVRLKTQEMDNLKRQTKIVSAMSPEGAAAMLGEMPEDQAIGVLFLLKPDVTSAILDTLSKLGKTEAKRAADLAARLQRVLPPAPGVSPAPTK